MLAAAFALAFQHAVDGHAGPAADDAGDVVGGHFLAQHRALGGALASASCFSSFGMRP
jgi:hypothetical protein